MGVDHTAFACYGVRIKTSKGTDLDAIEEALPKGFSVCEWGSRGYGGDWGAIVCATDEIHEVDFGRGCETPVALSNSLTQDQALLDAAVSAGCEVIEKPSWFVGGRTW